MDSDRLPDEAIVVRGGLSAPGSMADSVQGGRVKLAARGEEPRNILSVFTDPTLGAPEIVQKGQKLLGRWSKYRVTTVGALRALGYEVSLPDAIGHATLELSADMTGDDYAKIDAELGNLQENPSHKRRKRHG